MLVFCLSALFSTFFSTLSFNKDLTRLLDKRKQCILTVFLLRSPDAHSPTAADTIDWVIVIFAAHVEKGLCGMRIMIHGSQVCVQVLCVIGSTFMWVLNCLCPVCNFSACLCRLDRCFWFCVRAHVRRHACRLTPGSGVCLVTRESRKPRKVEKTQISAGVVCPALRPSEVKVYDEERTGLPRLPHTVHTHIIHKYISRSTVTLNAPGGFRV